MPDDGTKRVDTAMTPQSTPKYEYQKVDNRTYGVSYRDHRANEPEVRKVIPSVQNLCLK